MSRQTFFDSNVLIYAFTQAGEKTDKARHALSFGGVVSIQSLNETANTLHRKFNVDWPRIGRIIDAILDSCPDPLPLSLVTHRAALRIGERYGYSLYDGLIVASAIESNCAILLTEGLQHGQMIDGVRLINPFL